MNNKIVSIIIMFVCFSASFGAKAGQGDSLILNLVGYGAMYEREVPDLDGDGVDDLSVCFDSTLKNLKNNQVTKGTDCLSNISLVGGGVALVNTTFFNLQQGTIITRTSTSVQPVLHPTITANGQISTHITGASSDENAIIGGTMKFRDAVGTVRLSGMVDMSNFFGKVGDPIGFDCIFIIDIN
ncbi:MAG: hypothetical protein OEX12_01165 [Gammaproteobacteria bacterium]|nr:hypothetical protein [Gammaproteobacteria bacterium]